MKGRMGGDSGQLTDSQCAQTIKARVGVSHFNILAQGESLEINVSQPVGMGNSPRD